MTNDFEPASGDRDPDPRTAQVVRPALQRALSDRFDGVDWDALHARIMADAATRQPAVAEPWSLVARWAYRGIPAAGALLAAGLAALLILPLDSRPAAAAPPGFWPVAEELMAGVPEDTRRLIDAGADVASLLDLVLAAEQKEDETS
jgi:hypothetical protein